MSKPRQFANGCIYHIYDRGGDHRNIFLDESDYRHFLALANTVRTSKPIGSLYHHHRASVGMTKSQASEKSVIVNAYCLLPNHFHLLIRQILDGGISKFMQKLSGGYTSYFNLRYRRTGKLFEGRFRFVPMTGDAQTAYTVAYISGNYEIHGMGEAGSWPWSSFRQAASDDERCSYIKMVISESSNRKRQLAEEVNDFPRL
jgi:putative transposase